MQVFAYFVNLVAISCTSQCGSALALIVRGSGPDEQEVMLSARSEDMSALLTRGNSHSKFLIGFSELAIKQCHQTTPPPSKEGQRACVLKLIGGSDGGQGSIREGDSTINPFPQMRYFSAPSSVGVRIFNRGLHLLTKIAKAVP